MVSHDFLFGRLGMIHYTYDPQESYIIHAHIRSDDSTAFIIYLLFLTHNQK